MKRKITLLLSGTLLALSAVAEEGPTGERLFKHLDADNNDQVSEQEYVTAAAERARRTFKRIDKNGDGQLSKGEFSAAGKKLKDFVEERRQQRQEQSNTNQ